MPHDRPLQQRLGDINAVIDVVLRVFSFAIGTYLLIKQEAASERSLWIIIAAIGMLGPQTAQTVANLAIAIRGEGTDESP